MRIMRIESDLLGPKAVVYELIVDTAKAYQCSVRYDGEQFGLISSHMLQTKTRWSQTAIKKIRKLAATYRPEIIIFQYS